MNLLDYGRIIIRRGWIVILAVVITATSAFVYSRMQTPEYRASQQVLMQPARNDFGLAETLRILMRSYVEYLYTDEVAAQVINHLELGMTPGDLRTNSTINSDPTTLIIKIDVTLPDGETAARVAHEWGQLLVEWRNQQNSDLRREDRIEATLLDYPAWGQYRPNTKVNVLAGAILGILLGGVVVFVLEYLESSIIRTGEDIERLVELPVLASIPLAKGEKE